MDIMQSCNQEISQLQAEVEERREVGASRWKFNLYLQKKKKKKKKGKKDRKKKL